MSGVSPEHTEVDRHRTLRPAGSAAVQPQVDPSEGVLEVARAHGQFEAGAGDWQPALQLVQRYADPSVIQPRQRSLHAHFANGGVCRLHGTALCDARR